MANVTVKFDVIDDHLRTQIQGIKDIDFRDSLNGILDSVGATQGKKGNIETGGIAGFFKRKIGSYQPVLSSIYITANGGELARAVYESLRTLGATFENEEVMAQYIE